MNRFYIPATSKRAGTRYGRGYEDGMSPRLVVLPGGRPTIPRPPIIDDRTNKFFGKTSRWLYHFSHTHETIGLRQAMQNKNGKAHLSSFHATSWHTNNIVNYFNILILFWRGCHWIRDHLTPSPPYEKTEQNFVVLDAF